MVREPTSPARHAMHKSHAEEVRIYSRRSKVAALLLRGVTTQFEICERLGMEPGQRSTISRDVKAIKLEWRASAVRDFDQAKGRELAKLDALEKEYWEAWERSKAEKQSTRTRRRTRPAGGGTATDDEAEVRKEHRDGNPAFLEGALRCVDKRCEILGLNAAKKVRHGGDEDAPPIRHDHFGIARDEFRQLPYDERLRLYRQALSAPVPS